MHAILQDFNFAFRQLRKSPGFTLLAVFTLALGIGANTAMFTVVESVMLRKLPYAHPERMVHIAPGTTDGFASTSYLNYRDIRDQSQKLETVALYSEDIGVIQGKDGSVSVVTPNVTPNTFKMLGAQPLLGRTFTDAEGENGGPQVVVLSELIWRELFNADQQIIGKQVRVNGQARTVVGIMPKEFRFPEQLGADLNKGLWLPLQPTPNQQSSGRGTSFFYIVGLIRPGSTIAQVQGELGAIAKRIQEIDPKGGKGLVFRVASYPETLTGPVRPVFTALLVALGLVLLIACANVANLLIARCVGRQQEFAVRAALGAGQMRLVRQMLVEGALLSGLGCAVGFGLAALAIAAVHKLPQGTIPRGQDIAVHWTVVVTLALIATATTVLTSLIPAFLVSRTDPQPALQSSSRGLGTRAVRGRLSGYLVGAEVALSVLLLVSTGLLFRTLWNLQHTRLGFEVSRLTQFMAMPADATGFTRMDNSKDPDHPPVSVAITAYKPALERMRQVPGVQAAALSTAPPLSGFNLNSSFTVVGRPVDPARPLRARFTAVSGGFERVMGTPVARGRMISDDDTANSNYVVVINETLAHKYFADQDPLGQQIDFGGKANGMTKAYTIVGVLGDQVDLGLRQPPQPFLMLPYEQVPTTSFYYQALLKTVVNFLVKTRADIAVAPAMREIFRQTAPDYALDNFQTFQEVIDQSNFSQRLGLYLIGAFAAMAVLMVVAGLYGVLAQLVSYRRREIGVRLALGATRGNILGMVLRQGSTVVLGGIVVGAAFALLGGRLVSGFLYRVKPMDVGTYAAVIIVLMFVGALAAVVPARRAARIEPVQALRDE